MADDLNARDSKLVQYLNEAYGKEKELETALQAHIKMTGSRASYKKRLEDHLKETKAQAKGLERRIKQLGGKAEATNLPGPDVVSSVAGAATAAATKTVAAAKGPVHALRGTGEAEKLLKNAKTELWNEHEEIGNYLSIETLATALGDRDTAKLAREFRKQEERMAAFLQKLIPTLTKAVVTEEVPASERRSNGSRSRAKPAKRRATSAKRSASSRAKPAKRSSSSRAKPAKRSSSSRSSTAKRSASSRSSTAKRSASSRAKPAKRASTARAKPAKARAKPAKARAKRRGTTRSS